MNKCWKFLVGLFFVLSLTGCFGEEYDFSPPTVSLSNPNDVQIDELEEANINWDSDKRYKKETKDIISFAKEQPQLSYSVGEPMDLLFEHGDFDPNGLRVSVWKNDKEVELKLENDSFYLPKETGEYVIVVDLDTDRGNAQYVGNIRIQ
ncbi:hypothetical protein CVD28_24970 [Bacillus sp. M6-12]|uniref:hypothetical protein n=1 Tax=Bacillus sp. M6-12 TaxID=2054166 RepID=UPI000C78B8E2|nr:hypothetical protein [Bacillus sp. M6-12]PLS15089.1 hypothetical protein CVD28_24970 [Bacillus sp. M6-12]